MATISTEEFDELFDKGDDITPYMDMSTARHPNQERAAKRISMDGPEEMVRDLDRATV